MSIEDEIRTSLHDSASRLDLRGSGATEVMHRARRRQHRARRAGAVAAVGVVGLGAAGIVVARGGDDSTIAVSSSTPDVGLPDVGPLDLTWQSTPGGITGGMNGSPVFVDGADGLYALSTAPGSTWDDTGASPPAGFYRMDDDGSWVLTSGAPTGPGQSAVDIAAAGDVLYGLGTAPSTSGAPYDVVIAASTDGGETWSPASVSPVAPPSAAIAWSAGTSLAMERVPGATVAVMTTNFSVPQSVLDQAAGVSSDDPSTSAAIGELTDAGVEVVTYSIPEGRVLGPVGSDPAVTAPPTTVAPAGATADAESSTPPGSAPATPTPTDQVIDQEAARQKDAGERDARRTVVATIPWSQLGVTGRADLTTSQVLVERDGAWAPVQVPALAGVSIARFTTVGSELVIEGWADGVSGTRTLASKDGVTWRTVSVGEDSRIAGLGNVFIDLPWGADGAAPEVRSSLDGGSTWSSTPLGGGDPRLADASVVSFDSSSLGLAAIAVDQHDVGSQAYLVTTRDLVNWTVTPLSDITGSATAAAAVHVGNDRVVITATEPYGNDPSVVPASVTAIGTPVR